MITGKVTKTTATAATIDGVVYAISANGVATADADAQNVWLDTYGNVMLTDAVDNTSDVVFYVDKFTETDKFSVPSYFNRVVTAAGEIVELEVASDATPAGTMWTYTTDSDGISTLAPATNAAQSTSEIKTTTANIGGKYFANNVVFVYVDGTGSDLKVTVKEGVQKVAAGTTVKYTWNDDNEIVCVYVLSGVGAADAEDLLFAKDGDADGYLVDLKGNKAPASTFYVKGEAMTEIVAGLGEGLYTYSIDAETGRYTATAETYSAVGTMVAGTINQDKYVTVGGTCVDYTLAADCEIYDLSDNGMAALISGYAGILVIQTST